jgi:excisionase family DNA binding protein
MEERFLTPEEAAERLSVSPKSVREWLRTRKLKGVKAGRLWRVREDDLKKFLELPESDESERLVPGKEVSREELIARIKALKGKYAGSGHIVDDFLRQKHAELEEEERRWQERNQP